MRSISLTPIIPVIALAGLIAAISSCSTAPYYTPQPAEIVEVSTTDREIYRIQSGDLLEVSFPYTPDHNEKVKVRPDGNVDLDIVGEIAASESTPNELADAIKVRATSRLRDPLVIVTVLESSHKVYVGGEVRSPGIVPFGKNLTPLKAILDRGGFLNSAQSNNIALIRINDGKAEIIALDNSEVALKKLMTNDVIFVPKTDIAKANLAMQQYIRNMLPISTSVRVPTTY